MLNWIDRAIAYVAPSQGVRRARDRVLLEAVRGFDAASLNRRTKNWQAGAGSANAELWGNISTLRQRARDLCRNNGLARKAVNAIVSDVVGTGILADYANDRTQRVWEDSIAELDATGQSDYYGLQALMVRSWRESGEVLGRWVHRDSKSGLRVPLQLQVLESDFIDHTKLGAVADGGYIISGIEFDQWGRRAAYWLYPQHPGEVAPISRSFTSQRVPARDVLHLYEVERPGQVRGITGLVAAMLKIRDLDEFADAEMVRKKIEACFSVFVTTDDDTRSIATTTTESGKRLDKLAPGLINYLRSGEEVKFAAPNANGGYGEFTHETKIDICAGLEVPYEVATGDLSRVNYSSIRAGLVQYRKRVRQWQWLSLAHQVLNPIAARWLEVSYASGAVARAPNNHQIRHTMPRIDWIDALKEILAEKEELRLRGKSWREFVRERGLEPAKHVQELLDSDDDLEALGISLSDLVSTPSAPAPADASKPDDPNADDDADLKPGESKAKAKGD